MALKINCDLKGLKARRLRCGLNRCGPLGTDGGGGHIERTEQRKTTRIAMQIGRSAYRPDLAVAEKTTDRDLSEFLLKKTRVMAALPVEKFAPPKTREKQRSGEVFTPRTFGIHRQGLL